MKADISFNNNAHCLQTLLLPSLYLHDIFDMHSKWFFQCSKQQRPFISFLLQLLQSIPHRIVWFKNPRLILDMKVNGIEMLFSRFSDKDCMKISIKCLKKYLNLIQSGYSNFVLTEGFKTPLFFFLIQNVLLCQIYSFCCPKIFFISCRTSSTCIERNFPYRI